MNKLRVLCWDIETSHNLVATFRLFEDYTPPENILRERYIICAAWKWLGEKKTHAVSVLDDPIRFEKNPHDDYYVLKTLHEVLSQADIIVAHNGDKFDSKFTEARMLIQGFPPLPPVIKIDTLKVVKKRFSFNSNKLDYLGNVLGVGRKTPTNNKLWLQVLKGDEKAIRYMVKYNKHDVELLERVFLKLQPYMQNHPQLHQGTACPRCGSTHTQFRGVMRTATRVYQRAQCQDCAGWFRLLKSEKVSPQVRCI